jgi:PAS domain S-box-containing protein
MAEAKGAKTAQGTGVPDRGSPTSSRDALRLLHDVSTRLIRADDIGELYDGILDAAVAVMRADHAYLHRFDPESGGLRLLGWRGFTQEAARDWEWIHPGSRSSCGEALRSRRRVVVPDVARCAWMAGAEEQAMYLAAGIRAAQTTPLLSRGGALLGTLATHWRAEHEPPPEDVRALDVLARQAADLVDRMQAREALLEREAELRALLDPWVQAYWEGDPHGAQVSGSPSWAKYTGQSREEMAGFGWLEAIHPDDRAFADRAWREAVAARSHLDVEFRLRAPDGGWRWTNVRASPVFGADGRLRKWVGMNVDISARKAAEQALQESEGRQAFLLELMDTIRPLSDPAEIQFHAARLLGERLGVHRAFYSEIVDDRDYVIRRDWVDGLPSLSGRFPLARWGEEVVSLLRAGGAVVEDAETDPRLTPRARAVFGALGVRSAMAASHHRDGRWVAVFAVHGLRPRAWAPGEVALLREVAERTWAVVERAQAQAALRTTEEQLRESDRRKTEFLAVLSHELRNPLTPIRNSIYLLERSPPGSTQGARAREVLHRQTDHLARLVDDLLDATRISRGKIELKRARFDLREVVRRTTDDLRSLFEASGIDLRVERAAGPLWVDGDETRIAQVLGNLLHNAAKFTPEGGVVTVVAAERDGAATLVVEDTGAGIASGEVERMFEPFTQGAQDRARTAGGLGLGLALVKGLVELHGGTVRAHSGGAGLGAEFTVSLPLAPEARGPGAARGAERVAEGRRLVVIVEDNVDAGATLGEILELSGHRVHLARDARAGLALARELHPDLVLCDIGLPDMDGYDFARAVRRDPALARTRLIAVTGYAQAEDRARALEAGFDAHLAKPPAIEDLEAAMQAR